MNATERVSRKAQSLDLRSNDPMQVVALYRRAVGLNRSSMLHGEVDLMALIDAILGHETETGHHLDQSLQKGQYRFYAFQWPLKPVAPHRPAI